ncbi:CASP-like protein 1E1 [Juglans microcarpa x Juglans regia]|uniref:CASP-like protein 1E1 n=1 Tax=Juglans microcarpa x Juglans regia TaxID=2249226 RepID=UPI001B7DEF54|nr:CASP-like protein 1E1 [Juglans microcarpa x Juglans regia]
MWFCALHSHLRVLSREQKATTGTEMEGLERSDGNYMQKVEVPRQRTSADLLLRLLALALTLVSAITIGLSKQTRVVRAVVVASLPPLYVPVPARWHYISAFVYFLVANVIACSYATLSLVLVLISRKRPGDMNSILHSMILVLDILMVALLFSCNGASMAIGIIGYRGNTHLRWQKICNLFERFCGQVAASIAVSMAGAMMFILMVAFSGLRLREKSRS